VRNEKNLGRVANYRRALTEHARGEWVLMLDGDDYLVDPGFIRLAREALQRHADQNVVFAQAGHRTHYTNGERADADILPRIEGAECLMEGAGYLRFVYDTGFFTHLGTLYPRRLAIENGFYTADISSSDMDSLLRLALEGRVLVLKTIAGCWVQHGGNASSNLPLEDIAANVRIFRQIAHIAAEKKLTEMPQLEPALTRYEAGTLAYLFGRTVGKTTRNPGDVWKMLRVVISVNPRLLLNRRLLKSCRKHFRDLAGLTWRRWWSSKKRPEAGRKGSE
jgi:glycosyltransferase involved in cell wall biosynthesis